MGKGGASWSQRQVLVLLFLSQKCGNSHESYAGDQKGDATTSHGFVHRVKTPALQKRREWRRKKAGVATRRCFESGMLKTKKEGR